MKYKTNKEQTTAHIGKKVLRFSQGFTLVEVIVVLVIISLLAIFALPELLSFRPKMRLKGMADTFVENLQRAKMYAIKNNTTVSFTFTPAVTCPGGSYRFFDASNSTVAREVMHDLTDDVSTARTTNVCLKPSNFPAGSGFSSRGLALNINGGNATISNTTLNKTGDPTYVVIQSVSGGVSMKKVNLP